MRVVILDMQPISPPIGGGRLRLLGLYHNLDLSEVAHYFGTYDWRGEKYRNELLTPSLRETLVPLSDAHFQEADVAREMAGGRTVIDSIFHKQVHLSPDFLDKCRSAVKSADIIVYSHPWLYPSTSSLLDRKRQMVIYDAHNVEGKLRTTLLDDGGFGTAVAREVIRIEREICRSADLILTCSQSDSADFCRLYGVDAARTRVIPNGAFTENRQIANSITRDLAKKKLGISVGKPAAIFLGSNYAPNVEAAEFLINKVAPLNQNVNIIIAGGVGSALKVSSHSNVIVTGPLSEEEKDTWCDAADLALNPMQSGSGTNIKMLEFMAAGLPTISTPVGARGIDVSSKSFIVVQPSNFSDALRELAQDKVTCANLSKTALEQVKRFYSWEQISSDLGKVIKNHFSKLNSKPKVSVIIPTYERHENLDVVLEKLAKQTYKDFEVIIVDQSQLPWQKADRFLNMGITYVHTHIKGAVTARNVGAKISCGDILAFTDDDCEPSIGWLEAAVDLFESDGSIAGVEGLIVSDKLDDPDYRPVTNAGFEGIGFMTANLFIRSSVFQHVGGFDIGFENPHFREDTDLGWRVQAVGKIAFSSDAWIYHPPHKRSIERESLAARSKFFVKDARLMLKHPDRYTELFLAEGQWRHNEHFLHFLAEGLKQEGIRPTEPLKQAMLDLGLDLPDLA